MEILQGLQFKVFDHLLAEPGLTDLKELLLWFFGVINKQNNTKNKTVFIWFV